ncbi:MAG: histidine phosphatase family protein [Phyllobacteriaceae bacterium]|nr:histidine phosphatase family protein [Phyllobacteriaceae bacterium]
MGVLYLLRHAKAQMALPGQRDFDRPLAEIGVEQSVDLGGRMDEAGYRPALVLCSPALRTRQTLDGVRRSLAIADEDTRFKADLFGGDATSYLGEIRAHGDAGALMIVGHNPMIEDVACALAGKNGDPAALHRLMGGVPVAALAVIAFDDGFASAAPGSGRLLAFLTPGDE